MDSKCALADPALRGRDEQYETIECRKAAAEIVFFLGITHTKGLRFYSYNIRFIEQGSNMVTMDPLASLIDARDRSLDWRIVAAQLLRLEARAPLAPDGQPWIRAVEAISGYSANHVRRMAKAYGLLDDIGERWPEHAATINSLSFSHAEILGRLWETDRKQVERILVAERWPSYAQLLSRYEQSRSRRTAPRAAGKLAAGHFRAEVGTLLRRRFGPALMEASPHPYLKPNFLVALDRNTVLAWDCLLLPTKIDEDALRRRFLSWATESSFVSAFWIVTQDNRGNAAISGCIAELELANVGHAIAGRSRLAVAIEPHGSPIPDRRRSAPNMAFW